MPDVFDEAQEREQLEREAAIKCVVLRASDNRHGGRPDCLRCGDDIPPERREAVPGATRCTPCQTIIEGAGRR